MGVRNITYFHSGFYVLTLFKQTQPPSQDVAGQPLTASHVLILWCHVSLRIYHEQQHHSAILVHNIARQFCGAILRGNIVTHSDVIRVYYTTSTSIQLAT